MVTKKHLTEEGLETIVAIKSLFPQGLNPKLTSAFPDLPFMERPSFTPSTEDLDPNWIAGFANGDSSFT